MGSGAPRLGGSFRFSEPAPDDLQHTGRTITVRAVDVRVAPFVHERESMRRAVCLLLLGTATASSFACSDGTQLTSGAYAARRGGQGVPAPGTQEQHDDGDTEGADENDPGNPNADETPDAPATPGTAAGSLAVALSNATPAVDLGKSIDIDVTVQPKEGFTGSVALSATGLPAGATATFVPATVTIGASAVSAKLTILAPITTVPSAPNASSAIVVTAKSGNVTATANANFRVNPRATLTIPMNIDALRAAAAGTVYRNEWGAEFGQTQVPLSTQVGNGIVFTVFNADSKPHIIHGANGFAHGDTANPIQPSAFEMANGAPRTRTLNVGANVNGYPHEGANGPSASFRIRVQQAAQ